jgi:hypothetical protein
MIFKKAAIGYFVLPFILLFVSSDISSANDRSNFYLVDSLTNRAAERFIAKIDSLAIDSLRLQIRPHPADWLIEQHIVSHAAKSEIRVFTGEETTTDLPLLNPAIRSINIDYSNHSENDDLVVRSIAVDIAGIIEYRGQELDICRNVYSLRDTLSRSNAQLYSQTPYDFAKGTIPEPPESFLDKYIVPVVVVSSAAVTALLLFTVRSK